MPWNRQTFERLVERLPEMLSSHFDLGHGMLIPLLERVPRSEPTGLGYRALVELIDHCHEGPGRKARLRRRAALLLRSLRRAGIVEVVRGAPGGGSGLRVAEVLQRDFSLHETLSLYLVEAVEELEPEEPEHPLRVLTLVEAILEDPKPILREQARRARDELFGKLKAEGVPFEERLRQVERVTHPRPDRELVEESFRAFALRHPWVGEADIRPKSVARDMFEHCRGFSDTVREYQIARSEGLLLRYLSQVHNALVKTVPERAWTEAVLEVIGYLRALLQRVDSSLLEAWEELRSPGGRAPATTPAEPAPPVLDPAQRERRLLVRARAELHQLVRALAAGDYEEAAGFARQDPDDPWHAERFRRELAPFFESYEAILFTPEARRADRTLLKRREPSRWDVFQVLLDPAGDHLWALEGEVDLRDRGALEGPLVRVRRIGT